MNVDIIRRGRDLRRLGEPPRFDSFCWAVFGLFLIVSFYIYYRQAAWMTDVRDLQAAAQLNPLDLKSGALPLWTGGITVLRALGLPFPWAVAAAAVSLKMLAFLAVQRVISLTLVRDAPARLATAAALLATAVTAVRFPPVNPAVFTGVGSPNAWAISPQSAAPLIALACLAYAAHCIYELKTLRRKQLLTLSAVLLLAGLYQPSLMQAFLPACGVTLLLLLIRRSDQRRSLLRMGLALLPAAAWILAQALLNAGAVSASLTLRGLWLAARNMLMMAALPLFILMLTADRETLRNPVIALCLLFAAASVLIAAFFSGDGAAAVPYADVNRAGMSAAFLLWAVTPPRFINAVAQYHQDRRKLREYANRGTLSSAALARAQARLNRLSGGFLVGFILMFWHLYSTLYYLRFLLSTGILY